MCIYVISFLQYHRFLHLYKYVQKSKRICGGLRSNEHTNSSEEQKLRGRIFPFYWLRNLYEYIKIFYIEKAFGGISDGVFYSTSFLEGIMLDQIRYFYFNIF